MRTTTSWQISLAEVTVLVMVPLGQFMVLALALRELCGVTLTSGQWTGIEEGVVVVAAAANVGQAIAMSVLVGVSLTVAVGQALGNDLINSRPFSFPGYLLCDQWDAMCRYLCEGV